MKQVYNIFINSACKDGGSLRQRVCAPPPGNPEVTSFHAVFDSEGLAPAEDTVARVVVDVSVFNRSDCSSKPNSLISPQSDPKVLPYSTG
jgi:hypothetical protein